MKDRYTGKSRGFGFVTFVFSADAMGVAAMEHHVDGRRCEAKFALPRGGEMGFCEGARVAQSSAGATGTVALSIVTPGCAMKPVKLVENRRMRVLCVLFVYTTEAERQWHQQHA